MDYGTRRAVAIGNAVNNVAHSGGYLFEEEILGLFDWPLWIIQQTNHQLDIEWVDMQPGHPCENSRTSFLLCATVDGTVRRGTVCSHTHIVFCFFVFSKVLRDQYFFLSSQSTSFCFPAPSPCSNNYLGFRPYFSFPFSSSFPRQIHVQFYLLLPAAKTLSTEGLRVAIKPPSPHDCKWPFRPFSTTWTAQLLTKQ